MKPNIALIGFMGSGKTTVGKLLAKSLDMKFIDIDRTISVRTKKTIPEIFKEYGEEYFRDLERDIIREESINNNVVISTGGGSIIDNSNLKNLKTTSFIIFLDCDIETIYNRIKDSTNRPLILNSDNVFQTISELYSKRKMLYQISADFIIKINSDTNLYDTVETLREAYILS